MEVSRGLQRERKRHFLDLIIPLKSDSLDKKKKNQVGSKEDRSEVIIIISFKGIFTKEMRHFGVYVYRFQIINKRGDTEASATKTTISWFLMVYTSYIKISKIFVKSVKIFKSTM